MPQPIPLLTPLTPDLILPPMPQNNLLPINRSIMIKHAYILHSQPCPLCVIPTTVRTFCSMQNKLLLNPEMKIVILIRWLVVKNRCYLLDLVDRSSWLSGYFNPLCRDDLYHFCRMLSQSLNEEAPIWQLCAGHWRDTDVANVWNWGAPVGYQRGSCHQEGPGRCSNRCAWDFPFLMEGVLLTWPILYKGRVHLLNMEIRLWYGNMKFVNDSHQDSLISGPKGVSREEIFDEIQILPSCFVSVFHLKRQSISWNS